MDLIITILPVVTKDRPISPRFTPYDFFYRDASSALLQLVNQWLNFTYSRTHAFRYERKNTNPATVMTLSLPSGAFDAIAPALDCYGTYFAHEYRYFLCPISLGRYGREIVRV